MKFTRASGGVDTTGAGDVESALGRMAAMFGNFDPTSGVVYGFYAVCAKPGIFTKIRIRTGTAAPVAVTDIRGAVWDEAGNKITETANASATVVAASTQYDVALGASITAALGQIFRLGWGYVGTSCSFRGTGLDAPNNADTPVLARIASGYAGGALPNIPGNARAAYSYVRLVP